jgi:aminoglycoside phosphotransferase (APT) family kinase protein
LVAAWSVLSAESRDVFRSALRVDDAEWMRGRGWALSQALIVVPYYRNTNPALVDVAMHMIDEILADHKAPQ